jgi:hypothetical protein
MNALPQLNPDAPDATETPEPPARVSVRRPLRKAAA